MEDLGFLVYLQCPYLSLKYVSYKVHNLTTENFLQVAEPNKLSLSCLNSDVASSPELVTFDRQVVFAKIPWDVKSCLHTPPIKPLGKKWSCLFIVSPNLRPLLQLRTCQVPYSAVVVKLQQLAVCIIETSKSLAISGTVYSIMQKSILKVILDQWLFTPSSPSHSEFWSLEKTVIKGAIH